MTLLLSFRRHPLRRTPPLSPPTRAFLAITGYSSWPRSARHFFSDAARLPISPGCVCAPRLRVRALLQRT